MKLKFRLRWTWNFRTKPGFISTPLFYLGFPTLRINWGYFIPLWVQYYQVTKYEIESQHHLDCICSDPMNGCPGDFSEDFHQKHRGIQYKIEFLSYKAWKPGKMLANFLLKKLYEKLNAQYQELPWNQS